MIDTIAPSLQQTLTHLAARDQLLAAEIGPLEDGWFRAADLLRPDLPYLDRGLAHTITRYPQAERRVTGSFFIGDYVWYVAAAAVGCYLAEQRVPDLAAENVALRYPTYTWHEDGESGEAERLDVRFLQPNLAALPGDPAAGQPHVWLVPDKTGLRDWLRRRLEDHLRPLIETVYARTRLGKPAQWNLAADALAALFLQAGKCLGLETEGCAEGLALVKAAGSPLCNPHTGYISLEYQGYCQTFRTRGGCCLYYRLNPGENCSTCVLRPEAERTQRLLDYMARKYTQGVMA